jgi:hypothetical protein
MLLPLIDRERKQGGGKHFTPQVTEYPDFAK